MMETLGKLREMAGVDRREERCLMAAQHWRWGGGGWWEAGRTQPESSERCHSKLLGALSEGT